MVAITYFMCSNKGISFRFIKYFMKETRMNIPNDKLSPKIINRRNIYRYIDSQKNVTIQEIVQSLHLSNPTVVQNIKELQARDLLCISGTREKTGGRNAQTYSCNYSKKTAIGLDISAHHIALF